MTDRNTNKPRIRGGEEGVVVNFDEVQHENEELKAKNQELNQKIEELQNEIESLRGQVQYYQNFISSMGAVSDPPWNLFLFGTERSLTTATDTRSKLYTGKHTEWCLLEPTDYTSTTCNPNPHPTSRT